MSTTTTDQTTETQPTGTGPAEDGTQPLDVAGGSVTDAGTGTDGGDQGGEGGNAEAARRRRQLRDTEAERDTLAAHLERHRMRDLERAAAEILAEPSDLLALGGQGLAEFIGEDGDVDSDAVRAAARTLVETRPGLRAPQRPVGGSIGQGRITAPAKGGTSWAEALGR